MTKDEMKYIQRLVLGVLGEDQGTRDRRIAEETLVGLSRCQELSGFRDSHGGLWMSASPDFPGAEAFGPTGAAVQLAPGSRALEFFPPEDDPEGWDFFHAEVRRHPDGGLQLL